MVRTDSRCVRPGDTFVAVRGASVDGARFVPQALTAGATRIVSEEPPPPDLSPSVVWERVADSREAAARLACEDAGHPSHEVSVCAVTGTNGKTTVANLIRAVLSAANRPCGLLSTIENDLGPVGAGFVADAHNTTPGPVELQAAFRAMVAHGCVACAMEASSHALDQKRLDGTQLACAIFTNLTQDHLDYHKTMDAYFSAKARLFLDLAPAVSILYTDDPAGARLASLVRERGRSATTYGFSEGCDVRIVSPVLTAAGSSAELCVRGEPASFALRSSLLGRHNLLNLAAAFAAALRLGVSPETVLRTLAAVRPVRGRLEPVSVPSSPASFFVDYAHTPDALENVLRTLRELTDSRLFVVFGAGGDRDRAKRPLMGGACARLADVLVVTSDNPRSEDPSDILRDILVGVRAERPSGEGVLVEPDRAAALRRVRCLADRPGDVVLVAGKGHETYQIFANRTIAFDDREMLLAP